MNPPASAPLLTRIVTVYRQWDCVARWIDDPALVDPRVGWVFVNDCEGDPVPAALREAELGRRALFVEDGVNRGRSGARNRGAALTTSPLIAHLDGDDLPLPLDPAFVDSGVELLFLPFADGTKEVWCEKRIDTAVFGELFRALGVAEEIDWRPASLVWRRDFYAEIGGYDGRFEGAEDAHLVWKALQPGRKAQTARGVKALVSITPGGARSELIYLTAGRLRFWEEVARAEGSVGAIGIRMRTVQLRVVFWTVRDALVQSVGRCAAMIEGLKLAWNTMRRAQ